MNVSPSPSQLESFGHAYVDAWNRGDKQGFVENWTQFVDPEDAACIKMFDPVGTPMKQGVGPCAADPFDLWQPITRFVVPEETFMICDNEICWIMRNHFDELGSDVYRVSIENFRFNGDGTADIRTWFRMPEGEVGEYLAGKLAEYLPGGGPAA